MRILSLLSIIFIINLASASSHASESNISNVFNLVKKKDWKSAYKIAKKMDDSALLKIVLSQKYLNSKSNSSFKDITGFLNSNPDWAQGYSLKLKAEKSLNDKTDKKLIFDWFEKNPPITANAHKYYAYSASAIVKDPNKLSNIIKKSWHNSSFSTLDQKKFYKKFKKHLNSYDHVKKIDNHLWKKEITSAKNNLFLVNSNYKKSFRAQIALIQKKKNSVKLFKNIDKKYYTSGLIYRYIELHKRTLLPSVKISRLIHYIKNDKDHGDKFWKLQSYIAREFIESKKYRDAYRVTSAHFANSAGDKSQAEYLSGWLALRFLKKPNIAIKHFNKFNRIVKTPISKSRGIYWLARAYEDNSESKKANKLYDIAARKYAHTFYGQVAAVRIDKTKINLPRDINVDLYIKSSNEYADNDDIARAAKLTSKYGSSYLAKAYINSGVKHADNMHDIINIAYSIKQSNNIHHMAWVAKKAMQKNIFIKNYAYPRPYKIQKLPIETPLIYSIVRQESVFDQYAVSRAEARGLMQLIKSTACSVANKINTGCNISKLTIDSKYNIKLGSNYLNQMIQEYNGSYILAIAAYNAGPHNVNKWLKIYGDPREMKNSKDVIDWLEHIPFYETRNYVQRVLENLQIYRSIMNKNSKFSLYYDLLNKKR